MNDQPAPQGGATLSAASYQSSRQWYFAEGAIRAFETWILVSNRSDTDTQVRIDALGPGGGRRTLVRGSSRPSGASR